MRLIAVTLRYYKCYESTELIPLFFESNKFTGIIGENGVGKSAILEALHSFFTNKHWIRNRTGKKGENICGVAPIIKWNKEDFPHKQFSDEQITTIKKYSDLVFKNFSKKVDEEQDPDSYYVSCILLQNGETKLFDGSNQITDEEELADKIRTIILNNLKYVYIKAEVDIDSSADINSSTAELIKGAGIVADITSQLDKIESGGKKIAELINEKLNKYLNDEVVKKLQKVDQSYNYKNVKPGAVSKLTNQLISELATRTLFDNRNLTKRIKSKDISISDMSSGQRRRAFMDFIIVMISNLDQKQREKIILAIDEPEISVDASSRIKQFEKLRKLSTYGPSIVFSTHWYGWIAELTHGGAILIKESESGRNIISSSIEKFLDSEAQERVPYEMRMMFDFLSSLGTWAENEPNQKFVICEGRTDCNYLIMHFPDYKIIAVRGIDDVIRLHRIFSDYYLRVSKKPRNIAFLIDTDPDKAAEHREVNKDNLKRISRDSSGMIKVVSGTENYTEKCAIEDLLSPHPFLKALKSAAKNLGKSEQDFINNLSIKHPDRTGTWALGIDEVEKLKLKDIYKKSKFKLHLSELYQPTDTEKAFFRSLMDLF